LGIHTSFRKGRWAAAGRDLSAGYVMVDALVALVIVGLTLSLSLLVADRAIRVARQAQDIRQADALLRDLMVSGPRSFQAAAGVSGPFAWTVETQLTGGDRPIEVCRRLVQLTSSASSRRYWASTLETCPVSPS
jgi:hypothetical protein